MAVENLDVLKQEVITARTLNRNAREKWPLKQRAGECPFEIADVVTHTKVGATGIVRTLYAQDGPEWFMDVETSPGHMTYRTPCKNWRLASKAEE